MEEIPNTKAFHDTNSDSQRMTPLGQILYRYNLDNRVNFEKFDGHNNINHKRIKRLSSLYKKAIIFGVTTGFVVGCVMWVIFLIIS